MPEFRQTLLAFLEVAKASCDQLMRAIALSLGLAGNYFVPYHDRTDSTLRLLHYPPLTGVPAPGLLRAGAHTDFGGMNLLFQDDEADWKFNRQTDAGLPPRRFPERRSSTPAT
jgi:isopenicillin N synthase-like dioxygenase